MREPDINFSAHFLPFSNRPRFERLSDDDEDDKANVYSRLSDAKAYQHGGQAVDVWAQKTGGWTISCKVVKIYSKKP